MAPPIPYLLTPHDVAELIHVPSARVLRLVRVGELPHIDLPGGEILIDATDLARWIESRRRPPREEAVPWR